MFTVTTGVCLVFYAISSSNVTVPCPSFVYEGEHLIAFSHSRASISGCMSAATHISPST